ncbi:ABC transporter substrate-binding protein [Roseicyclus sp. F158]|uniref:ABC transporter substrate-binding protein n=1 Tax=Tropicimonas omnivorans TaxID=3075590 RepID=A0ABU3DH84_9RHOB|nr:ABC transporter substrate-binding protein [Roseicyclus sp. F158]MDT0683075.1 ABC transporter substrate-binding protein [Roseicyclus sp. F158]
MTRFARTPLIGAAIAAMLPVAAAAETLQYAGTTAPLTFDPHSTNDYVTTAIARQTYESLVELGPDSELIPGLATEWEYVGDATWRLSLREGVSFHDGTPMTAEDVAFSVMRQATSARYASLFGQIVEARVVDESTVEIVTEAPDAVMPVKLSRLFVMSKAWAEENGIAEVPQLGTDSTEACGTPTAPARCGSNSRSRAKRPSSNATRIGGASSPAT